ncbi:hypothetical protein AB0A74_05190 [Saccharothrix sp. NPDC042600]|uniref:hypothetical protein n=1 Tax=Saccharothrix TaxID=2071 RepID=UPI00340B693B|nr:hypothetical protein GCM10017745_36920 [Saccharothrix mutabilis subsp. capreolus]
MIDSFGDVHEIIKRADAAKLEQLFAELRLEIVYNAEGRTVDVTIRPAGRVSARVREVCPNTRLWGISHSPRRGVAHKSSLAGVWGVVARVGNFPPEPFVQ